MMWNNWIGQRFYGSIFATGRIYFRVSLIPIKKVIRIKKPCVDAYEPCLEWI